MTEKSMDVQQAIDWAAQLHADMTDKFNNLFLQIPRWGGPPDWQVQTFINGLAHWVGANVQWSYESERYFGKRGLKVRATMIPTSLSRIYCMSDLFSSANHIDYEVNDV